MLAAVFLTSIAFGTFLYRWRGGGYMWLLGKVHRAFKLAACAAFVTLPCVFVAPWWLLPAVFGAAMGTVCLGHGAYMDLQHTRPEREHDRWGDWQEEPDHAWLLRRMVPSGTLRGSRYAYEAIALSYTGFIVTLAPAIALSASGHWLAALALGLSGALKGPAYMLAWDLYDGFDISRRLPGLNPISDPVALAESLFGAALGLGVGVALLL